MDPQNRESMLAARILMVLGTDHRLIHTIETAPEKSKPLLELFTHAIGFVPNLAGAIARRSVSDRYRNRNATPPFSEWRRS